MALNKNSISQIIKTDIFFNSCANENKEIIELINHLEINNNYEYPKNIVIHNIISKIFITRNEKYLIIIEYIIDKLIENKDQIIDVKDSLMFIMKKIILYKKTNITGKNKFKDLEDKINNFLNLKNVKLDEGKSNKKSNLNSSENDRPTLKPSTFTMPSISSKKDPLNTIHQENNVKHIFLDNFKNIIREGENQRTKGSNKKSTPPISKGIHYDRTFISQSLNSLVNINDGEDTLDRGINYNEINPVYKPILSKGLENTGKHYCHMSVCIQLLFSCDDFRDSIREINLNSFKNNTYNESLVVLDEIQKIFNQILDARKETNSINYSESYNILYNIIFPKQKITNQQDSTDILVKILNYNFINIFNFNYINKQPLKNNVISNNNILLLSEFNNGKKIIPNTLQNIINIHTKVNDNNYSITIKNDINKYIIITLNRRSHNNTSYSSDSNGNIIINNKITIANNKYFLVGSIIKIGTSKSGHYIYVTYDSNGNIYKVYNDSTVKNGNIDDIYDGYKLSKLLLTSQYILLFKRF